MCPRQAARSLPGENPGRGVPRRRACKQRLVRLLFLPLLCSAAHAAVHIDFKVPPLDRPTISSAEAARLGREVRPFVPEWNPDTAVNDLVGGADNETRAFGRIVTVADVINATKKMDQGGDKVPRVCFAQLLELVEAGMMRLLDDLDLGAFVMQRLRQQQRRLGVTAADADLVMLGTGCSDSWAQYLAAEKEALDAGLRESPAARLASFAGTTFSMIRSYKRKAAEQCFSVTAIISLVHFPYDHVEQWVNVVYPTRLFADYSRGGELLKPIFESHAARDVVLSFRGSIMKKDMGPFKVFRHLVEARYNNVRELYAKRHTVKATGMLRKIFYAPGVMGLSDLDGDSAKAADADADALEFSRVKYLADPVSGTLVISLTYLRSHFCFQPSGDDDYRRGIFDSLQLGCIPVLLPQQRDALQFMAGGTLQRAGFSSLDEVFYFLPENQIKDGSDVLETLRALAADEGYMAERRRKLFEVARLTLYSTEDGADDVLTRALGLMKAGEHY